ncbi:unnamed protein product [Prunus armeniaca]|uniref:MYB transcription factor n=1 Tax=Prunus armeniaca TaxID=36596 RepID=A0A6J5X223_PRUAR|nr:unnamed protein product [Prunus armeniaca]
MKKFGPRPWTVGEDRDLIEAVERYGTHRWEAVARFLGTRTGRECQSRWVAWLHPQIRTDEWSQVEDAKLRQLSTLLPAQWQTIADMFNGSRTAMSCRLRHSFLLENPQKISNQEGSSTLTKKAGPPQRISSQEGSSSFTQKAGPPQRIYGNHTTNSQPKSGEKKVFWQRSTPRRKIDLGDNSFSNLKKENEKAAMKEKEKEKAAAAAVEEEEKTLAEKEEEKTPAVKEEEKTPALTRALKEEDKTPAVKEEDKTRALKEEDKTPAVKEEEKTPALKEEEKTPALKEEDKTPALKEEENSQR